MYQSDMTLFINGLFKKKPQLREEQIKARQLWWDRPQSVVEQAEIKKSLVPVRGYAYYTYTETEKKADEHRG